MDNQVAKKYEFLKKFIDFLDDEGYNVTYTEIEYSINDEAELEHYEIREDQLEECISNFITLEKELIL